MKHLITISLLYVLFLSSANAQGGSLDKSFGENGVVIDSRYETYNNKLLLQSDGKIISVTNNTLDGMLLKRYNKDGSFDESFNYSKVNAIGTSAAINKNGKIAVAGIVSTSGDGSDLAIVVYKANGTLDSSFASNGQLIKSIGVYDQPCGIFLQDDGKIIIAGGTQGIQGSPYGIFLLKYNSDGTPDNSFDNDGIVQLEVKSAIDVTGFKIQSDKKILIGGSYLFSNKQALYLRRFLENGSPDNQFGNMGEVLSNVPNSFGNLMSAISQQIDGKILVCGISKNPQTFFDYSTLVRFNIDGTPDLGFGNNSFVATVNGTNDTSFACYDLVIDKNGKIITANRKYDETFQTTSLFSSCRYNQNGSLDSTFGSNGIVTTDIGGYQSVQSILLQPDGKFVIGGQQNSSIALIRYNGDNEKTPIYVKIKKWLLHHGFIMQNIAGGLVSNYIVQRSNNGIDFTNITASTAITNAQATTTFQDNHPLPGLNYYRVQATNMQGLQSYSNIITVTDEPLSLVKLYPNPVKNTLHIEGLPTAEKTKLSIIDFNGNTKAITTITGNACNWNIAQLNKGNYMLKIEQANAQFSIKFIKE